MTPFQSISEACRSTGLSQHFLRQGCRDGTVPHVMSGCKYLVNVPLLLRQLGATVEEEEASAETQNRPVCEAGRQTDGRRRVVRVPASNYREG